MTQTLATLIAYLEQLSGPARLPELVDRLQIDEAEVAEFIRFSDCDYLGNLLT